MNEDALRTMIREAVAKRLSAEVCAEAEPERPSQLLAFAPHASHFRYPLPASGGPCLIEPSVPCSHCGYCESHGH